jgi:hypothetical protein
VLWQTASSSPATSITSPRFSSDSRNALERRRDLAATNFPPRIAFETIFTGWRITRVMRWNRSLK